VSGAERRAHARVAVPLRAAVEARGSVIDVSLRDLSKGGAFLYTERAIAPVGETLKLTIWPPEGGSPVNLRAEVARTVAALAGEGGGVLGVGVRFEKSTQSEIVALDRLLSEVLRAVSQDREPPRISTFLRVQCGSDDANESIMQEISRGGLILATDRPLRVGERVEVQVAPPNGRQMALRGRVSRVEPPKPGALGRVVLVEFDELSDASRGDLDSLLEALAKA
jgi:Tfp pilus assembly protein PilZ